MCKVFYLSFSVLLFESTLRLLVCCEAVPHSAEVLMISVVKEQDCNLQYLRADVGLSPMLLG